MVVKETKGSYTTRKQKKRSEEEGSYTTISKNKWQRQVNGKKKEKYYLYRFVTFKYNLYTLFLSFTLMVKLTRRRRKHKNNYNS